MKLLRTLAVALAAGTAALAQADDAPKYIFYYIGDGMGLNPTMTAETYNRTVRHSTEPLLMMQFPVASWCTTYSASSPITDSAAAGTALSTGVKTRNNMLGMNPDTIPVTSIAKELYDRGWGVGIVTSVSADDATPGAFYAHVPSRKDQYDIDIAAARSGYDFIAGSGLNGFRDREGRPTDLEQVMADNNVQIVRGRDGIATIDSRRVVVLNDADRPSWDIGYTIDSIPGALTLPLLAETCLRHIEGNGHDRFFMMVEGGNIDHALHGNDGGAAVKEILNFNEALDVAYRFYLAHPDETLIIVTADHDTGGSAMVHGSMGDPKLGVYDYQRVSKDTFSDYCKAILGSDKPYSWEQMRQYLTDKLGFWTAVPVSESADARLRELYDRTFNRRDTADQKTLYNDFNAFAVEVFRILNNAAGVKFTSTSHSGAGVPVFAIGAGAQAFSSLNDNAQIPARLRRLLGIK